MLKTTILVRSALGIIVLLYWMCGALYAIYTPNWQVPDEPAHYNYVAQVAAEGCCPVIEPGDWDSDYLATLTGGRFAPSLLDDLPAIQYEDHQPPLYYLLQSVIFQRANGDLTALRLASVLMGTGVVLAAYATARIITPARPGVALGTAAFVAFLPQHLALLSGVNNDALAEVVVGWTLFAVVLYVQERNVPVWTLGLLVGIGFLTKTTTYFTAGVVLVAITLRGVTHADRAKLLRDAGLFLVVAVGLGLLWWGRNLTVYGVPDFLGLQAHDAVVVGQPRTAERIADVGATTYLRESGRTTFNSFWGQFGWMAVPLPPRIYTLVQLTVFGAVSGLIVNAALLRRREQPDPDATRPQVQAVLGLVVLLAFAQFVYYNLTFLQLQGRYLFPALIPLAFWFTLGLDGWRRLVLGRFAWSAWLTPLAIMALCPLSLYLLWRVLVPYLQP